MALRDEIRQQRQSLKGKGAKAYLDWFLEYNLAPTIGIVAAVIVVVCFLYVVLTGEEAAFGVMFINAVAGDGQSAALAEDFAAYSGLDLDDLYLDLDEIYSTDEDDMSAAYYTAQSIIASVAAGEIDVLIADPEIFTLFAEESYFLDLTQVLDEEVLEEFSDCLYYVDLAASEDASSGGDSEEAAADSEVSGLIGSYALPDPAGMEDPAAVGIVVNDSPYLQEQGNYDYYVCILGFVGNTDNPGLCAMFLDYLFEQ